MATELIRYQGGKVLMHPEAVKLFPVFKNLKGDALRYVHLSQDYRGMLKQFPPAQRAQKARLIVYGEGGKSVEDLNKEFKEAIETYQGLQYDVKRATVDVYLTKIVHFQSEMMNCQDPDKINKYITAINNLNKNIDQLQKEIDQDESKVELKGSDTLTLIEEWHHNLRMQKKDNERLSRITGVVV